MRPRRSGRRLSVLKEEGGDTMLGLALLLLTLVAAMVAFGAVAGFLYWRLR